MKMSRRYTAVALSAALFSFCGSTAFADPTPSPSPTFDSYKAAQEQFKKDRDAFMAAMRERESKLRDINALFKAAVDKATSDARTAMSSATTPEQKNAITTARRMAVAAAVVARESAISALGPLPTPPIEPARPMKMGPQSNDNQKGAGEQKGKQKR